MLNYTNTLTRKKLLKMMDKSDFASAVISKTGQILFYNEVFKSLIVRSPPENIFKILEGDERSNE